MDSSRGYHLGQAKERIIEKALEHLYEGEKIQDLSLRQIAREIGISSAAPYRHFPTSNDLIASVGCRGFELLVEALEKYEPRNLTTLGKGYVEFAWSNPQLYRTMYYFPSSELATYPELAAAAGKAFALLEDRVEKTCGGIVPDQAALASWAFVHGWADLGVQNLISRENFGPESLELSFSRFIWGLKHSPETR